MFEIFSTMAPSPADVHGLDEERHEVEGLWEAIPVVTRLKNSRRAVMIQIEHPEGEIMFLRAGPGSPWKVAQRHDKVHVNSVLEAEMYRPSERNGE